MEFLFGKVYDLPEGVNSAKVIHEIVSSDFEVKE